MGENGKRRVPGIQGRDEVGSHFQICPRDVQDVIEFRADLKRLPTPSFVIPFSDEYNPVDFTLSENQP